MKQLINVTANLVLTSNHLGSNNDCYDEVHRNSCYNEGGHNSCNDEAGRNSCYEEAGRIGLLLRILQYASGGWGDPSPIKGYSPHQGISPHP